MTIDPLERYRNTDGTLMKYADGGYAISYLDREGSILCPTCAYTSDQNPDEVPQFKPVEAHIVHEPDPDLRCDHCSDPIPLPDVSYSLLVDNIGLVISKEDQNTDKAKVEADFEHYVKQGALQVTMWQSDQDDPIKEHNILPYEEEEV